MAAQYDAFGTYLGDYESEEERKRREELANTAVHTQEIKTYGDGTQERVTKEEIPGAIAPKTVLTAAGPVAPDELYQRQLQAESGNRQTTPGGQVMTSPKGALGIAQIMPSTAMSPGFGVPDIFTLAEQRGIRLPDRSEETARQLLANKELNQAFGQNYSTAMRQRFGDQAGVAAYNAGPGAVERNMARNQGQFNVAQAPQETQGYMNKVLGGIGNAVNAVIPSAQAGTLPAGQAQRPATITPAVPTPIAPQSFAQPNVQTDDNGNKIITNPDGTTTLLGPDNQPMAAGGMVPQDTAQFRNRLFEEAGKDPFKWMMIAKNPEYAQFPALNTVAKEQARALFEQEFKLDSAKEQATKLATAASQGDARAGRAIADELKNQEGSWLKMILLGFLSPQLAGEEAVKLGFGDRWQSMTNDKGESAYIKMNARGMPLSGISADNKTLTQDQLAGFMSNKGLGKGTSLSAEVYVDPTTGARYRSGYDNAGNAGLVNIQGGGLYKGDPKKLVLQSVGTTQAKADIGLITDLKKKHGTNVLDAEKDYVALNGPFKSAEDRAQFRQAYGFDLAQPSGTSVQGGQVVQGAPASVGNAPAVQGGAAPGASNVNVPLAEQKVNKEVSEKGRTEIIKKAGDVIAGSDKLVSELVNVERAATDAITKKNNFGTIIHGTIPGEQTIGKVLKTQDHINTQNVLDVVNKQAAVNAKMLGTNPTDRDLQFVTATKPDETWPAEAVADWLRKSADATRRTLDFARKQIETGGRYIPETPQPGSSAPLGSAQNPIKIQ